MKPVAFHPQALAELGEEALYYNERSPGLGVRFTEQVELAVHLATTMPGIGSPHLAGTRRVFPKDFPHSIVYREIGETIVIFAVAAFRRTPGYWKNRKWRQGADAA